MEYFEEYLRILSSIDLDKVTEAATLIRESSLTVFCGNGGSYSVATHMAGDLLVNAPISGNTMSLGDNTTSFSALSNDVNYGMAFSKELECRLRATTTAVVVLISTSGRSPNVVNAGILAKAKGFPVISLVGSDTSMVAPLSQVIISLDSKNPGLLESAFGFIGHMFVENIKGGLQ